MSGSGLSAAKQREMPALVGDSFRAADGAGNCYRRQFRHHGSCCSICVASEAQLTGEGSVVSCQNSPVQQKLGLSSAIQLTMSFLVAELKITITTEERFLPAKEKLVFSCADKWKDFIFTNGKKSKTKTWKWHVFSKNHKPGLARNFSNKIWISNSYAKMMFSKSIV